MTNRIRGLAVQFAEMMIGVVLVSVGLSLMIKSRVGADGHYLLYPEYCHHHRHQGRNHGGAAARCFGAAADRDAEKRV